MKKLKKFMLSMGTVALSIAPIAAVSCNNAAKKVEIGATVYNGSDPFITLVQKSMEKESGVLKVKTTISDSQNDQTKQNDQVDALIKKGAKVLAINLVSPDSAETVITKAKNKGIPIIIWNKEAKPAAMKSYDKVWYVGTKSSESGDMQAQLIYDDMVSGAVKDRNADGELGYFVIGGEAGHADALARTEHVRTFLYGLIMKKGINADKFNEPTFTKKGTTENIKENPNHVISVKAGLTKDQVKAIFHDFTSTKGGAEWTDWSEKQGKEAMAPKIASLKEKLDFVPANNDGAALGAIAALKAKSDIYKPYTKEYSSSTKTSYIPVYGVDATGPAIQSIKDGWLGGTVLNDAKNQGMLIIIVSKNAMDGKTGKALAEGMDVNKFHWDPNTKAFRVPYVPVGRNSDAVKNG